MRIKTKSKADAKTKKQLISEINSLRKRVARFEKLESILKRKDEELKECVRGLEERVESRTAAERIINKQLHSEIEERKKLESELFKTKQFLENIVNGITEQIMLISKDFKILWANKTFLEQFNCKMEDLAGNYCYAVTHNRKSPCQAPYDACPIAKVLEKGIPVKEVHTHYGPRGESLSEVSAYPIKDEKGQVVEFVHIARNIKETKP
ncbi:MAG: PAS domain-containing protein [Candidatus Omnitrophica bacterium]|nr:PAS domain-containing protein [Candidatus Omnitrophota bacterium]